MAFGVHKSVFLDALTTKRSEVKNNEEVELTKKDIKKALKGYRKKHKKNAMEYFNLVDSDGSKGWSEKEINSLAGDSNSIGGFNYLRLKLDQGSDRLKKSNETMENLPEQIKKSKN